MKSLPVLAFVLISLLPFRQARAQRLENTFSPKWVMAIPGTTLSSASLSDSTVLFSGVFYDNCTLDTALLWCYPGCPSDSYLARYKLDGTPRWIRRVGGRGTDRIKKIVPLPGGDFLIAGEFNSPCQYGGYNLVPYGMFDGMIARMDSNGTAKWVNKLGYWGGDEYLNSVSVSGDSLAVVGGSYYGGCYFDSIFIAGTAQDHAYLAGIDLNTGRWRWARKTNGYNHDEIVSVTTLPDTSIVVTGMFNNVFLIGAGGFQNQGFSGRDIWVGRMDKHRQWSWARQIGGSSEDYASKVAGLPDGSSIVVAMANRTVKFLPGTESRVTQGNAADIFLVKYSKTGRLLWVRQMGGRLANDWASSLEVNLDGNLSLSGYVSDTAQFSPTQILKSYPRSGFLARMDTGGRVFSLLAVQAPNQEYTWAAVSSHTQISNNQFLMAGNFGTNTGSVNIGTYPYQSSANEFLTVLKPVSVVTAATPAQLAGEELEVYPNPGKNRITVRSKTAIGQPVVLIDAEGKEVLRQDAEGSRSLNLNTGSMPAGIYMLQIGNASRKLVLDK